MFCPLSGGLERGFTGRAPDQYFVTMLEVPDGAIRLDKAIPARP